MTDARRLQAFVHTTRPDPDRFDPPTNADDLPVKPAGGLWTSTLRIAGSGCTCSWVSWCRAEEWGLTDESVVYALRPVEDPTVYDIHGTDDLAALLDEYGRDDLDPALSSFAAPDYEALREDGYDAVHLSAKGQRDTRMTRPGLYGWDCESTLWLRWAFEDVTELGPVDEVIP